MLFEVALIEKPTKTESEEGAMEKLVLPPVTVIARDDRSAAMQVVLQHKDKISGDISRVEALVRPFA